MSNAYDSTRGNVTDRQRRKLWLLDTYRADQDLCPHCVMNPHEYPLGSGIPACRCYRCGKLLTYDTLTVDRIIPGCKGGKYRRDNIRPSCSDCANKQGGELSAQNRSNPVPVVRPRVRQLAARDAQPGSTGAGTVPVPGVQASRAGRVRRNGSVEE